jgi:hypothetical protein
MPDPGEKPGGGVNNCAAIAANKMAIAAAVRDRRATVFKIGDAHYHTGQH